MGSGPVAHGDGARPAGRFAGDSSTPGDGAMPDNAMPDEMQFQRCAVNDAPAAHSNGEAAPSTRVSPYKTALLVRNIKARKDPLRNGTHARNNGGGADAAKSASQTQASELLPLTKAQRGIWIGGKISRAGTIFNIAEALEIMGPVDPALFRRAILQVVREADTTRTNILEDAEGRCSFH